MDGDDEMVMVVIAKREGGRDKARRQMAPAHHDITLPKLEHISGEILLEVTQQPRTAAHAYRVMDADIDESFTDCSPDVKAKAPSLSLQFVQYLDSSGNRLSIKLEDSDTKIMVDGNLKISFRCTIRVPDNKKVSKLPSDPGATTLTNVKSFSICSNVLILNSKLYRYVTSLPYPDEPISASVHAKSGGIFDLQNEEAAMLPMRRASDMLTNSMDLNLSISSATIKTGSSSSWAPSSKGKGKAGNVSGGYTEMHKNEAIPSSENAGPCQWAFGESVALSEALPISKQPTRSRSVRDIESPDNPRD
ncbi:hypothetical protein Dda_2492 [Drechslerella dactyloides]|uniref:Uncharacterized protein n=1 Tax=Drechslerella dactyloides TaxID=74499 RepID=A0AAD6J144_DREDA|nr:hypothetical protein Dda_2492 [Drechslerella dactyloides]